MVFYSYLDLTYEVNMFTLGLFSISLEKGYFFKRYTDLVLYEISKQIKYQGVV